MTIYHDIKDVPTGQYDLIMADPPWRFSNWSAKGEEKNAVKHYACMTLPGIQSLLISDLAAKNCLLWIWATNPMLPQAIQTLESWGFTYKTAGHWVKRTKNWKLQFGTGYVLRSAGEPFIIGTIGSPKTSRSVRSVIEGRVGKHSEKPVEAFEAAEQLMPDARRIELFSRTERPGWDVMGDEIDHAKA